jgi:hypothetical protein
VAERLQLFRPLDLEDIAWGVLGLGCAHPLSSFAAAA